MEAWKEQRATERGEGIRAELLELLAEGPATADSLAPRVRTPDVDLREVVFQLDRLAEEERAVGAVGEAYRLP